MPGKSALAPTKYFLKSYPPRMVLAHYILSSAIFLYVNHPKSSHKQKGQFLKIWFFDIWTFLLSRKAYLLTPMIGQESDLTYHSRWWIYFDIWSGLIVFIMCKTVCFTQKAYFGAFLAIFFAAIRSTSTKSTSCTSPLLIQPKNPPSYLYQVPEKVFCPKWLILAVFKLFQCPHKL